VISSLLVTSTMQYQKMVDSNKPPEILEKIIGGQLRKFYEQICLTEQSHMVEEGNPKVGKFLQELGLELKDFKFVSTSK
jgi:translation elongation factor EF-Ts